MFAFDQFPPLRRHMNSQIYAFQQSQQMAAQFPTNWTTYGNGYCNFYQTMDLGLQYPTFQDAYNQLVAHLRQLTTNSPSTSSSSTSDDSRKRNKFTCNICKKTFTRKWLLVGHERTHTGEKPFTCEYCGKRFADKSNLRAHTQTHSKTKNFHCKKCGKGFTVKSYLSKHQQHDCTEKMRNGQPHGVANVQRLQNFNTEHGAVNSPLLPPSMPLFYNNNVLRY